MKFICSIFLFAFIAFVSCEEGEDEEGAYVTPEEMEVIQQKLDKLQIMENVINSLVKPETGIEQREDEQCLPVGRVCSFTSGPRCCGIRTRCVIWDTLQKLDRRGSHGKWWSHCREYNGGVWLDKIGKLLKSIG